MSNNSFDVIGVSSYGNELLDVKREEGIKVYPIEMSRKITPIKDIKSLWSMYRLLKKEKPQIVHTHTPKAGIVGMLAAKFAGIPIRLHTVAGLPLMEAKGNKRKILDFVEKLTYSSATKIYPNSLGLYNFILQNGYASKDKLHVIADGSSNGIDTNFFSKENISLDEQVSLKTKLIINENDFVFVFVGRLVGDKGINELISAFSKLQIDNVKLLLVGSFEAELDPLNIETLKEINTNSKIISVGFQKDVRPYFAISNVLVFPSYREGFPNVVMQAGAMELPSIVSNINGCNEIVQEGKNGTIISVKSSEEILNAMQKLISDKNYYASLQINARPMIQSRYEQSVVWEAILDEYNLLISQLPNS
ncbi:glycosyltransferase family 4 protein [Empedobacter falsenii]|uniref:Glycosyltransferase family 4 protein n=1 Tax=Empedobacter falsenii TaxID=343874 RepID=A0A7H9DXW2_9FLAO|nr:glycosyltransferase family 4 protein [Empedobacter falsenii]QLL59915.1 glycosyltransferase family 4 protein [Empedobacter falsenii]